MPLTLNKESGPIRTGCVPNVGGPGRFLSSRLPLATKAANGSTPNSSNNEEQNFDQEKHLQEIRDQVNQEFQPESDKALADLRKAADVIVRRTVSEHQQLGLIRDAADDLNLGNQPDDALRERTKQERH